MVVIHGTLFNLLRDDAGTGKTFYTTKAMLFFLAVLFTVAILAVFIVIDSFAHLKKIMRMCKKEPEDDDPRRILDSLSSDSLTEREVSLEDDDKDKYNIELYDPKKERDKIELAEKKKQMKMKKKKKGM